MGLLLVDQLFLVLESAPTNLLGWYLFCKLWAELVCDHSRCNCETSNRRCSNNNVYVLAENKKNPWGAERHTNIFVGMEFNGYGATRISSPSYIENWRRKLPPLKQYPFPQEAKDGIRLTCEELLKKGILTPCKFPCKTALLSIKKPKRAPEGKLVFRYVQWFCRPWIRACGKIAEPFVACTKADDWNELQIWRKLS